MRRLSLAALLAPAALAAQNPSDALDRLPVPPPALRIEGLGELRLPAGRGPFPVAIVVHGGCWLAPFADDRYMRPLAEALRDDGIATWSVRYRRADEPGGGWPGTLADVAAAADSVRSLARRFPLDTTRVITVGHSAGATLGAWLAARTALPPDDSAAAAVRGARPLRVHGVAALDGPLDLPAARPLVKGICGSDVLDQLLGGTPDAQGARWRTASPAAWLAPGRPGLRQAVVVGGLDAEVSARIPAAGMREYARRADARVFLADTTDHFSMLDPSRPAWAATRDAVRAAFGRAPEGIAGADRAALRAAYRTFAAGMHARSLDAAFALLAPDFAHHALGAPGAPPRISTRAQFVARVGGMLPALDSIADFTIDVTDVTVRGDSAWVRYREHADLRLRPSAPGAAPARSAGTSWWRDAWVRTPGGWRAARFEEVPPPAARR